MTRHAQKGYRLFFVIFTSGLLLFVHLFIRSNTPEINFPVNTQPHVIPSDSSKPKVQKTYDLQPTIDQWASSQNAQYSIVVYDPYHTTAIGSLNDDTSYFAASLYKLYVAYFALIDFQNGIQDPDEILIYNHTKKQCVDKMIRSSDSPCGEALMADMGQQNLNTRAKEQGYTSTRFDGIITNATDCAKILSDIIARKDLTEENTLLLLDAMTYQDTKFKRGLATGASNATWATKVGWNENYNYHDVGIMTLHDNRQYIVVILSKGNGSPTPIANFASVVYDSLIN